MKGFPNFRGEMNRSERMQLKAFICLLGILLLLILIAAGLLKRLGGSEEEPPPESSREEEHVPVTEYLHNVWIMGADSSGLLCFTGEGERLLRVAAFPGEDSQPGTMPSQTDSGEHRSEVTDISRETAQSQTGSGESWIEVTDTNWGTAEWLLGLREQVADLELTDGMVTALRIKPQKTGGKVLAADSDGVWLEEQGRLEYTEDVQGYRLYGEPASVDYRDLCIGYDFADFCLEDGRICAILLAREPAMENIRVLLKNSDFQGIYHDRVELTCDTDYTVQVLNAADPQETVTSYPAGESVELTAQRGARLLVTPSARTGKIILESIHRSQGIPAYRGSLELWWTQEGIVLINELPLEEYLYSVVPSEMPASYPQEALKAQAICARTYAYTHMLRAGYEELGAHVDDSSSYQVYNNILEQEAATAAVKATYGQLLVREDGETLAETYYYSTSWGYGSDAHVWKTDSAEEYAYIIPRHLSRGEMRRMLGQETETVSQSPDLTREDVFAAAIRSIDPGDFESGEGWYRWSYTVRNLNCDTVRRQLQSRYEASEKLVLTLDGEDYVSRPIGTFKEIRDLVILTRGAGGVADELLIETDRDTYKVISEHTIRYILCDGETKALRQDGSEVAMSSLLPSAFFTIEIAREGENVVGYNLTGGGFGHGVGMSQNGARAMAQEGYSAGDILRFFYDGCFVR